MTHFEKMKSLFAIEDATFLKEKPRSFEIILEASFKWKASFHLHYCCQLVSITARIEETL